jgi:hypothetical protein
MQRCRRKPHFAVSIERQIDTHACVFRRVLCCWVDVTGPHSLHACRGAMVVCARDWYVDIRIRMSERAQRWRSRRAVRGQPNLICHFAVFARLQQRKDVARPVQLTRARSACRLRIRAAGARAWRGDGRVQAAQAITTDALRVLSRASVVASVFSCRYSLISMYQMHIKRSSLSSSLCMIKLVAGQE